VISVSPFFLTRKALGCPYLQGMDDSVVEKVLFTPGEARLRVLRWLVERCEKDLLF